MKRIGDMRGGDLRTMVDAENVMQEIAHLECEMAHSKAVMDKTVQFARERHADRVAPLEPKRDQLVAALRRFIESNTELFEEPRKHVTDFGQFGLQKVTEVEFTNKEAAMLTLNEPEFEDCVKVVRTPIKSRIKDRLEEGEEIPGCYLKTGDTVVYKVAKSKLDEAKQNARTL